MNGTSSFPRLRRGETVGVVSPGFAVRSRLLDDGLARLRELGYRVRCGEHVLARDGYLAGDDSRRLSDLETMLRAPEVRAIWFARGGYGTARLLGRIPWRVLRRDPKLLIGYSDLTALFCAAVERAGSRCLYAPVVMELGDPGLYHAPSLRGILAGRPLRLRVARRQVLAHGRAAGRLMGGNLTVLSHLCGTRFMPDLRGSVLFLEEVGEEVYRIDRMLNQLEQAGAFRQLAGVLIGAFSALPRRRFPPDRPLLELLQERFLPLGVPVVRGLPVGHLPAKRTLPLGAPVRIDTVAGRVTFTP